MVPVKFMCNFKIKVMVAKRGTFCKITLVEPLHWKRYLVGKCHGINQIAIIIGIILVSRICKRLLKHPMSHNI